MKICNLCGIEKDEESFSLRGVSKKTGNILRRQTCKRCRTKRITAYRKKGAPGWEKHKVAMSEFKSNNKEHLATYYSVKNKEPQRREQQKKCIKELKRRNIDLINNIKSNPCADCGVSYHTAVMDFDHVRGVKVGNISTMAWTPVNIKILQEELAKCEVVCSNCHRLRTVHRKALRKALMGDDNG